jgi:hypothetical protein
MTKFLLNLFQSLGKFKNPIFNSEIIFLAFSPANLAACSASGPASPPAVPFLARLKSSRPAHLARASVASSREIRFPFQIRPSRAGRLSHVSLSTGPHLSESPPSLRRPTPVRNFPAPLPHASDAPELLQPSLITHPPNPLQTKH